MEMDRKISFERQIYYITSKNLLEASSKNPAVINRSKIVDDLIRSYNLMSLLKILESKKCSFNDLRNFHTQDYCEVLKETATWSDEDENDDITELQLNCGLGYDCPIFRGLYDYVCEIGGSTITACKQIVHEENSIVINWFGGWHHAEREKAAGYCYVNDIVLGILILRQKYSRILYIDLDVHHGDGVQNAFESTKHVLTLSFHQYETGFYPGSGDIDNCGFGASKGYSLNFPYKSGISGHTFWKYFYRIASKTFEKYSPTALIIQCGADAIVNDPLGGTNLMPNDLKKCVKLCLDQNLPTVLLGGGGYNFTNTSRYWCELTAMICGVELSNDIPDNEFFLEYSPCYELQVSPKKLKDFNTNDDMEATAKAIEDMLNNMDLKIV